ncbi:hypothetical protein [Photorhabdus cinerea]|uniref:PAAR domain-containing protein n=1 Tax=Photorhabdus cinerea TaxID=471575 RepID=A0A7X5QG13_9GAMM|nr:hypothetical protein [Photorhabdus cinerea]NHB93734.1 hypothetical protein [Photorhabdus cinerea]
MGNAVKMGDIGTAHDDCEATPVISGSTSVKADGIPLARQGDSLTPHSPQSMTVPILWVSVPPRLWA